MSKISLRWRITILMGILVTISTILLTVLSMHNMRNSFVTPLIQQADDTNMTLEGNKNNGLVLNDGGISLDAPENVYYTPEIKLDVRDAQQSFSSSGYLYMALVILGAMIAAYYLAGCSMHSISALNNEIKGIDKANLSKRVQIPKTKDEIENLAVSFNKMLTQLEQEFKKEQRFSANAAHELKTPLATIITSAQVLQLNDQTTMEEYKEYLEITLQSARRLSKVVEGLLMLNAADIDIRFEEVSVPRMVSDILKELEPIYQVKNITLRQDLCADTVLGNPLLLYRAFFNIIENAYKYTEIDGFIEISSYEADNETVVRISDTGIGISQDDAEHIFEPFYRADKSRSRKIAGAGLGLSITKQIFDLHKADINIIHSEKQCGTTIEVRLKSSSF